MQNTHAHCQRQHIENIFWLTDIAYNWSNCCFSRIIFSSFIISMMHKQSTPCKHPVIVLQDVAFNDLHALVEFIYHGEVNVHQRSLSSFLKTAEVLRVSGLTQQQAEDSHNVSLISNGGYFLFEIISSTNRMWFNCTQIAQIQGMTNSGARTPISHHQSFTDKMVEEALFPHGASPPPHLNSLHSSNRKFTDSICSIPDSELFLNLVQDSKLNDVHTISI